MAFRINYSRKIQAFAKDFKLGKAEIAVDTEAVLKKSQMRIVQPDYFALNPLRGINPYEITTEQELKFYLSSLKEKNGNQKFEPDAINETVKWVYDSESAKSKAILVKTLLKQKFDTGIIAETAKRFSELNNLQVTSKTLKMLFKADLNLSNETIARCATRLFNYDQIILFKKFINKNTEKLDDINKAIGQAETKTQIKLLQKILNSNSDTKSSLAPLWGVFSTTNHPMGKAPDETRAFLSEAVKANYKGKSAIHSVKNLDLIVYYFSQKNKLPIELEKKSVLALMQAKDKDGAKFTPFAMDRILKSIKGEKDFQRLQTLLNKRNLSAYAVFKHMKNNTVPASNPANRIIKQFTYNMKQRNLSIKLFNNRGAGIKQIIARNPQKAREYLEFIKDKKRLFGEVTDFLIEINKGNCTEEYLNGLKFSLKNCDKVLEYKVNTTIQDITKDIPEGEFFTIEKKLYIRKDKKLVKLNMDKDKALELFPFEQRYNFYQMGLGDCWLISSFDKAISNPLTRVKLLKMFRQEGDDILIKFPNGEKEIRFKAGRPIQCKNSVWASKGIALLEQAYAVHRKNNYHLLSSDNTINPDIIDDLMEELDSGNITEAMQGLFKIKKEPFSTRSRTEQLQLIQKCANNKNYMLFFDCNTKFSKEPYDVNKKYGLVSQHQYSIKSFNKNNGTVSISNPHDTGKVVDIPIFEFLEDIGTLECVKI